MCCSDIWQAGKQRNIGGVLTPKQSIAMGNAALPMTHLRDTRGTKPYGVIILPLSGSSSCHTILLIDDNISRPLPIVFLIFCRPFFFFSANPPPTSPTSLPPTSLPILYLQVFSFVTWIHLSLISNIIKLSIPGFHSAFISSSQHDIQLNFRIYNWVLIPALNPALIPSFKCVT